VAADEGGQVIPASRSNLQLLLQINLYLSDQDQEPVLIDN
jgi:hypothetical protein